jgi:hypothetical protein
MHTSVQLAKQLATVNTGPEKDAKCHKGGKKKKRVTRHSTRRSMIYLCSRETIDTHGCRHTVHTEKWLTTHL